MLRWRRTRENDGTAKAGGQGDPNRQRGTDRCRSRRIGVGDPARCALVRVGVRKDGGQRAERFAGEEFGQKRAIPKCAPSEIVSSCSRPDSRKEPPSFFSRKSFFHSLNDKCQTATPVGPSTPPPVGSPRQLRTWASPEVASLLNRLPFLRRQLSRAEACRAVRRRACCVDPLLR